MAIKNIIILGTSNMNRLIPVGEARVLFDAISIREHEENKRASL